MKRLLLAVLPLAACAAPGPGNPVSVSFDVEGGTLHYRDAGHGRDALVLVHGWASDTTAWRKQFPDLADLGRLIAVDLPGHGGSSVPAEYSMAGFADSIAAVLDHAGAERAVLVGHSNGTPVVYNFYARHPDRTLGLVLVDGALRQMIPAEAAEPMFAPFLGDDWQTAMRGMIESMPAPGLSDEDRALLVSMALSQPHETVVGGFDAAMAPDAFPDVTIEVPVLMLMTVSPSWTDEYRAFVGTLAPGGDYRELADTGHYVQVERPDVFRRELAAFLASNGLLLED